MNDSFPLKVKLMKREKNRYRTHTCALCGSLGIFQVSSTRRTCEWRQVVEAHTDTIGVKWSIAIVEARVREETRVILDGI